jgi:hypothetical protein
MKYSGSASLVYPGREMAISSKIEQTRQYEYHTSSRVQWQRSREIREKSMFKYEGGSYSFNSDIDIPDQDTITIEGHIAPRLDDFAAKLKLNAMNEIYSGDVAYSYTQQGKQFTGSVSADVLYPGRHIAGTSDMKLFVNGEHSLKMDVKWDADNDEMKALVVDALYKLRRLSPYVTKHEASATVTYPGRKVLMEATAEKGAGEYKAHALVDWEDDHVQLDVSLINTKTRVTRTVSGNIKFISPFTYVEHLSAGFNYNSNGETYRTGAEVNWSRDKKITATVMLTKASLQDMEGNIAIVTPFNGITKMGLKGKYLVEDKQLSFVLGGEAEDKRIEAELTGKYKDTIEGALKVDLPFLSRSFGTSFSHKREGNQYLTNAEVMWDRVNKILATLDLDITSLNKFGGTLQLETPFSPVTRFGAVLTHGIQDGEMTSKLSGNLEDQQMTIEVKGKNNNSPTRRDMEGSIRITTPFENFDDMSLSLKHNDDSRIFTSSMSTAWQRTKRVTASFYMKHQRQGWQLNNQGKIQITTPFSQFQRVGYEWKHQNTDSALGSEHTVNINAAQWGINLGGNLRLTDGYRVDATLALKTPISGIRSINSALEFEINKQKILSTLEITSSGRRASAGFSMSRRSWREMEGAANLDIDAFMASKFYPMAVELKTEASNLPYTGYIKFNLANDVWSLDLTTRPESWNSVTMKVTLTTPLATYESMVLDVAHTSNRESSDSSITFTYQSGKAVIVQVKSNYEGTDKIKGNLLLTTPFDAVKSIKVEFDHDKDYRGFTEKAGFEYESSRGKTSFTTGFTYYGPKYISGNMKITTPYENIESFSLGFKHQRQRRKSESTAHVEYANKKGEVTATIEHNPVRATIGFTSPFEEMTSASLTIQHDGEMPNIETSLNYVGTHFGEEVQVKSTAKMESYNQMNGNFRIIFASDIWELQLTHKVDDDKIMTTVIIDMQEEKKINAAFTCSLIGDSASLKITTPFRSYEEINVGYAFVNDRPMTNLNINANVGSSFKTSFEAKIQGLDKWEAMVDVKTPIAGYEKYQLNLEYENKNLKKHKVAAILELPTGKNELSFTFQNHLANQPLILQFLIKTPSYFLTSLSLDLEHSGTWSNFEHNLIFDYDAYISRVHIENKWVIDGLNHIFGDARMTSPIKHFEYTGFSVNHRKDEHEWATSGSLEYSPGKRINFKNEMKFDDRFEVDFEVTTPFRFGRIAAVKIEHEGGLLNPRKNEITLEFDSTKLTSEWEMEGMQSINGVMKFTSRINGWERITLKATHAKERHEAVSEIEIKLPSSEEIKVDVTTKMRGAQRSIKIQLRTPFKFLSDATLEYSHMLLALTFKLNLQMTNWENPLHLEGNFRMPHLGSFNGNLDFRSAYQGFEELSLTFSNDFGLPYKFTTEVSLALDRRQSINLNSMIDIDAWKADISLTTPFKPIQKASVKFDYNVQSSNELITSLVEIEHLSHRGLTKLRSDWSIDNLRNIQGELKFTSPYPKARLISFEYTETRGTGYQRNMKSVLTYNKKKIEYTSTMNRNNGKLLYSYVLKTPWEKARDVQWNYEMTDITSKTKADFSEFMLKYDFTHNLWTKKMMLEIEWKITEAVWEVMTKSSSQWYDDFTLSFTHTKKALRNCETVLNAALGTNNVEWTSKFELPSLENMKGHIQFNFPVPGMTYRTNTIVFTHSGNLQTFKSSALYDTNSFGKYAAEMDWDTPSLIGVLKIFTPHTGWENIHLNFEHQGSLTDFTTTISANTPSKELSLRTEFKLSPSLSLDVKVKTPFEVARDLSLVYTHVGDLNKFECNTEMKYNNDKTITGKLQFQKVPTINVRIDLETPFEMYERNHIQISHSGDLSDFTCSLDLQIKEPFTGRVEFQLEPSIQLKAQMTTNLPHPFLRNPKMMLNINGELKNFQATFNVMAGQPLIESSADFQMNTGTNFLKFTAGISTDIFLAGTDTSSVKLAFIHSGDLNNFDTDLQMSAKNRRREKKITANVNFKNEDKISLKARLNTPFRNVEENSLEFEYSGEENEYETTAKVKFNREQTINARVNLQTKPKVTFKAEIETPFDGFEVNSAEAEFSGSARRFTTSGKITSYRRQAAGFTLDYMNYNFRRLQSTLTIYTPLPSYESMTVKVTHHGNQQSFTSIATYEDARNGEMKVKVEYNHNPITLMATIISPIIVLDLVHNGNYSNFQSTADLDVYDLSFKTKAIFNMNSYRGSLNVYTPWTDVMLSHNGDLSKFKSNITATYSGKKVDAIASFDKGPMIAVLSMSCPYSTIKIQHTGPIRAFRSTAHVTYGDNAINAIAMFNSRNKITGSATFTSPFTYAEDLALAFSHFGSSRQFKTEGSVQWEAGKTIDGEVEFRRSRRNVVTNVEVNTPFQGYEKFAVNLNHHGPKTQFRSTLSVLYMTTKRIQAVVTYQHLSRGTFTFTSPIKYIESIAATFNSAKVNNKDGYHTELSWAPQKTITADVTGSYDGVLTSASANGYMKLRTPFEKVKELIIQMEHSHSSSYLGNTFQVDHNSKVFIETNIVARRGDGKMGADATMSVPWPLKAQVNLNTGNNEKGADIEVNWDTTKYDKMASLHLAYTKERSYNMNKYRHSIKLTVPRRVFIISSNIDKTKTQFSYAATVSMNGKEITFTSRVNNLSRQDNTDVNGVIMLATPFRTFKSVFLYQRLIRHINLEYNWFWNFAQNPNSKVGLRLKVDDYTQLYGANFEVTAIPPKMPNMPKVSQPLCT